MCVGSLDHLDNCKSFEVFNIFKSMSKNNCIFLIHLYVRKSLPFFSRFTSILMLEVSQLRLLNNIPLLSVYLSQSNKKW